ncbi:MAG: phenylacetate--CoA ligase family protein, partial [Armatimonadetes bacterium]|nr:phenylacetate--CoA ligase family protein [Armatimonadota bacterium]
MPTAYAEQAVECAPLGQLRAIQDGALADGLARRAMPSALYRQAWADAGVAPDTVRRVEDLQRIPYITGSTLRQTWASYPPEEILCAPDVRVWFATSGTTGAPKWTPYARADVDLLQRTALRDFYMCAGDVAGLRCLVFATPAPFISDGAGYFNLFGQIARGVRIEYLLTSYTLEQARAALALAATRKPDAIIAFPSLAMRLAEMIAAEAPASARAAFQQDRTLRNLAVAVAARLVRITAKHVLGPRIGIFAGESLAPFRTPLRQAFGLEPFELYAMTEFPCFHLDCPEHAGMHFWSDVCIPEVIPQTALEEEETRGTPPRAIPLLDAEPGTVGELVLTTWNEALPLIRYRTADLVEIVGTGRCGCGRTHPRVRIRSRRDDLINFGLIRFSTVELETRLQTLSGPSALSAWQLHIVRE